MSAMRNAVPQRTYRERDQPKARARLGLLEKHKDYSARAKDYNAKKARLKALRQKAADRNEDEFHFGMMSSHTQDGVKVADRGNKALSNDAVKLLKTQDAGYLRTVRTRTSKERERLESQIQFLDNKSGDGYPGDSSTVRALKDDGAVSTTGNHTVFVDDENEQQSFSAESWFDTDEQGLKQTYNRPRRRSSSSKNLTDLENGFAVDEEYRLNSQERLIARLNAVREREQQLLAAEQELELQRAKMSNNIGGVNKNGVKFRVRQRKR